MTTKGEGDATEKVGLLLAVMGSADIESLAQEINRELGKRASQAPSWPLVAARNSARYAIVRPESIFVSFSKDEAGIVPITARQFATDLVKLRSVGLVDTEHYRITLVQSADSDSQSMYLYVNSKFRGGNSDLIVVGYLEILGASILASQGEAS